VPLENTIKDFKGVLEGKYDDLPEMAFYMVGDITEVQEKADNMAKEIAARKARDDKGAAAAMKEELKDVPPLAMMASEIKDEVYDDEDDTLDADFKAEAISGETKVLNESGKEIPLPKK